MATKAQLAQYCVDHGYVLPIQHTTHWSFSHMNWFTIGLWAAGIATAFTVGRVGLPTAWSDLTALWTKIRGWFSSAAQTSTATSTPVAV